ncbi:MAG: hypothetical protein WCI43_00270 [Candidatus Firestonebacteria bacterium]
MDIGETLLRKQIDENLLKFIKEHICSFTKLDIIRFFGLNPSSRVDAETLSEITNNKTSDIEIALKQLVKSHILEEVKVENKTLFELSRNKDTLDYVKRFISCYGNPSTRLLIIGYMLNKCVEKK